MLLLLVVVVMVVKCWYSWARCSSFAVDLILLNAPFVWCRLVESTVKGLMRCFHFSSCCWFESEIKAFARRIAWIFECVFLTPAISPSKRFRFRQMNSLSCWSLQYLMGVDWISFDQQSGGFYFFKQPAAWGLHAYLIEDDSVWCGWFDWRWWICCVHYRVDGVASWADLVAG